MHQRDNQPAENRQTACEQPITQNQKQCLPQMTEEAASLSAPATAQRILLTGAAGRIGTPFFHYAKDRYTFRLVDRVPVDVPDIANLGHETMVFDITDLDACQRACHAIDTVIHLGADPNPSADFANSLLHNNILGTYNILRASKDQGCRRVILASSVQVAIGYAPDVQIQSNTPARPINMYGVSKCFVEDAAAYFAYTESLSCIVVRIGAYEAPDNYDGWLHKNPRLLDILSYVSPRDLNQLLTRCIDVPAVPFAIVAGISNNRFKRFDLTSTRELLGYQPMDDGFDIFQNSILYEEA